MEEKDLCKTCAHYWRKPQDFQMSLDIVISHCDILDRQLIGHESMDDIVPYPCLKCPFESYKKKQS